MSAELLSKVSIWIKIIGNFKKGKLFPMFPNDYKEIQSLVFVEPDRVIRDKKGNPTIIMVDKQKLLTRLKDRFKFFTKEEATEELKLVNEEI